MGSKFLGSVSGLVCGYVPPRCGQTGRAQEHWVAVRVASWATASFLRGRSMPPGGGGGAGACWVVAGQSRTAPTAPVMARAARRDQAQVNPAAVPTQPAIG